MGVEPEFLGALRSQFRTTRVITGLNDVQLSEWDVLVTTVGLAGMGADWHDPEIHVLAFTKDGWLGLAESGGGTVARLSQLRNHEAISVAAQLHVPSDVPKDFRALAKALSATIGQDGPHACLLTSWQLARAVGLPWAAGAVPLSDLMHVLVGTSDGFPIAAWWSREGGSGTTFSLPLFPTEIAPWLEAAIGFWRERDPTRFPATTNWAHTIEWETAPEASAREAAAALDREREIFLADVDQRRTAAQDALHVARESADAQERVLLTGTGDALAAEVIRSLVGLGFDVEDMDKRQPANDRIEDLRLTDKLDPDWIVLADVTGSAKGGAKSSDLIALTGRFSKRFQKETGRYPTGLWYIVNQRYQTAPAERPRGSGLEAADLAAFEGEGVVIVDTIDLFRLLREVEAGRLTNEDARMRLRTARGVFVLTATSATNKAGQGPL
jgi:hypothetical protein